AQVLDDPADVFAQRVGLQVLDAGEVELLDELAVNVALQVVETLIAAAGAGGGGQARVTGRRAVPADAVEPRQPLLQARHGQRSSIRKIPVATSLVHVSRGQGKICGGWRDGTRLRLSSVGVTIECPL